MKFVVSNCSTITPVKNWAQILIRLSIVCFLLVSSNATAHAFPMSMAVATEKNQNNQALRNGEQASEAIANCHQSNSDSPIVSLDACEVFCSVMSNLISTEFSFDIGLVALDTQIAFHQNPFDELPVKKELHPPKITLNTF